MLLSHVPHQTYYCTHIHWLITKLVYTLYDTDVIKQMSFIVEANLDNNPLTALAISF